MSTYMPKPGEIKADWHVIDASGQVLGRLAARISLIPRGTSTSRPTPPTLIPAILSSCFNADKVIALPAKRPR